LLLGLHKARELGVRRLTVKSDSELVTGHVDKSYEAHHPELAKYLATVRGMVKYFLGFGVRSFLRALNKEADELAKAAAENNPYHQMSSSKCSSMLLYTAAKLQ
jgi:ribonuclease HI